jgi:DNA repair protein RadC
LKLVSQTSNIVKTKISSSKVASDILREIYHSHDLDLNYLESAFVLFISRNNTMIGYAKLSEGGTAGTIIDAKYLFSLALKHTNTSALILCHNHPSGNLNPSSNDVELTKNIARFGKMIDLPVLDHIILTEDSFYSFADNDGLNF